MTETLSIVLFSGTDDRLQSAAILAGGAAALGRPVNVLLQFWALEAFRKERDGAPPRLAPEAGSPGEQAVRERAPQGRLNWLETFREAKELGEVSINACSASMDLLALDRSQLDPLVDGTVGVATFFIEAEGGQLLFI